MGRGKPSSLKTEIYDSILKDIIEGNYKQNEIINEKQLIEKYGVSKSPIRDALIELCSEGVLISHPRYGYEVVRINEKEIRDIVNFRIMIETGCLRDAASIMTRADIRELREFTLTECHNSDEDTTILEHWDNMLQKSIGIMTRAYAQRHWERWGTISIRMGCENHLKVIDYLMDQNVGSAVDELRKDIDSFLDILYPNYGNRMYV